MAVNVDSSNFDEYLAQGLQEYGIVTEVADIEDVEEISDVSSPSMQSYTMPLVKEENGQYSYGRIGINAFVGQIAEQVATTGLLAAPTEAEFNTIFD